MFGYVKPYMPELRMREYDLYRALYCGLCGSMKKTLGRVSTLSLSYDFVFFVLCRLAADGTEVPVLRKRCIVHPFRKRQTAELGELGESAGAISVLLTYLKLCDDLKDGETKKVIRARLLSPLFKRSAKRANLPMLDAEFRRCLDSLSMLEYQKCDSPDRAAEPFGALLGAAFAYRTEGNKARILYEIGKHTGRFLYLIDAADDLAEDLKTGSYNPFAVSLGREMNAEEKKRLHSSLLFELKGLESAIALLDTRPGEIDEIIKNIIYIGLPRVANDVLFPKREEKGKRKRKISERTAETEKAE